MPPASASALPAATSTGLCWGPTQRSAEIVALHVLPDSLQTRLPAVRWRCRHRGGVQFIGVPEDGAALGVHGMQGCRYPCKPLGVVVEAKRSFSPLPVIPTGA